MESAELRPLIAIVDDDLSSANILAAILEEDYETFIATTGAEALVMIKGLKPDLVLLDIMLPDIGGYKICAELKTQKETAKIPVIFVTGLEEGENGALGFAVGAVDYQSKPINADILKVRIARILDNAMYIEFLEGLVTQKELTIGVLSENAEKLLRRGSDKVS